MRWHQIRHQPERARTFLGSPSLLRLQDGALLATHDYFGPGSPRTHNGEPGLTSVYRSEDDGVAWQCVTHIVNSFWAGLFCHRAKVYLLGVSSRWGSIVIRRSDDGGFTWTHPADEQTGLLFRGGEEPDAPAYHCAPMPVVVKGDRLYRAFEYCEPSAWGRGFRALVISAPVSADLLLASSWRMSNKLPFDPAWVPPEVGALENPGWLEGNAVVAPDGEVWNVLRFNAYPLADKATIVRVEDEGRRVFFDPATGWIDMPGANTKFSIRRDPLSGEYLSLVNDNTDPARPRQRNVLSLAASQDLIHWRHVKTLLTDDTGLSEEDSAKLTGFQYVDWQFDGDDIIYIVRVAYRGAVGFHDSNRICYCVLRGFRSLL